jgi:CO/xanthine dehydrogenase Mo-binding subunit
MAARREVQVDSPFTIKPRDSVNRAGYGAARAVRTELSPSQSVTAARTAAAAQTPAPAQDGLARESLIDPQAHELINRVKDERERRKDRRASDDALLRQRAYARADENKSEDGEDQPHANLEI